MVRFAVPVLLTEIDCVPLLPTVTLPKLTLPGLAVSCAAVPVPVSETFAGELEALLTTETFPAAAPIVEGAKVRVKEALPPAASVAGSVKPLIV